MNKTLYKDETEEEIGDTYHIVVFNDDVNSFQAVIVAFIVILGHNSQQAEQLATNIHNTGKASVKEGSYVELEPLCTALCEAGLSAELQIK